MTAPTVKALIGEVAKRHGITLKPDDPAFALVTLNQLILEQAVSGLSEQTRSAAREFAENLSRLQSQTGSILGTEVRNAASQLRQAFDRDGSTAVISGQPLVARSRKPEPFALAVRWVASGVVGGLALFVLGVLVGHFWK
jgi:hypothetical protein